MKDKPTLSEALKTNQAKTLPPVETLAPKGWERGSERLGNIGKGSTGPLPIEVDLTEQAMLEKAGFDPEEWELVPPINYREWDANVGNGEVRTFQYRKFDVRKRAEHDTDLQELVGMVDGWRHTPFPLQTSTEDVFIVSLGDLQLGKALADETPVFTPNGWVKHGDIRPGDYVYSPEGKPVKVLAVTGSTMQDLYRVNFDRGHSLIASGDHLWQGRRKYHPKGYRKGGPSWEFRDVTMTTSELAELPLAENVNGTPAVVRPLAITPTVPVEMPERDDLLIDPYIFGLWLGDGSSATGRINKGEADREWLEKLGTEIPSDSTDGRFGVRVPGLSRLLREEGVLNNKHVPEKYLQSSVAQRLALLQGLMDTDGYISKDGIMEFSNTSQSIADAMAFILSSFGVKYRRKEGVGKLNGVAKKPYSRITFSHLAGMAPFRSPRKAQHVRDDMMERTKLWWVGQVEPVGKGMAQCLTVEGSMYLAGEQMIPTHNCDGDGPEGTLKRVLHTLDKAVDEYLNVHHHVKHVHLAFLGDCIEGFVSQGGKNAWRTKLTLTEQIRLTRRIMMHAIQLFAKYTDKLTVVSVPGNHDEAVREPVMTTYDDSFAVDALVACQEAMDLSPHDFSHVETVVPQTDTLTVTMDVNGSVITHAHGHQWRPGKHWEWWQGQAFEPDSDPGKATILLSAHGHHMQVDTKGSRTWVMIPAFESHSQWWLNKTGDHGSPGLLTMLVGGGKVKQFSVHQHDAEEGESR